MICGEHINPYLPSNQRRRFLCSPGRLTPEKEDCVIICTDFRNVNATRGAGAGAGDSEEEEISRWVTYVGAGEDISDDFRTQLTRLGEFDEKISAWKLSISKKDIEDMCKESLISYASGHIHPNGDVEINRTFDASFLRKTKRKKIQLRRNE